MRFSRTKLNNMRLLSILIINFLLGISVYGQIGPAGIGNSDGSGGEPRNEIWFDASSLGLTNGDNVTNWLDVSGNNNNGEQVSAVNQPLYYDALQPGYSFPVVYFDGTNDFIPFDGSVIAASDYTVVFVGQRRSDSGFKVIMGGTDVGTNNNLHLDKSMVAGVHTSILILAKFKTQIKYF